MIDSKVIAILSDWVVELHWEESATNGATQSSLYWVGTLCALLHEKLVLKKNYTRTSV